MIKICKKVKAQLKRVKIIKELHFEKGQNYDAVNRFKDKEVT